MEMGEHPPGWRKPAKLPMARYERPISHLFACLAYGTVEGPRTPTERYPSCTSAETVFCTFAPMRGGYISRSSDARGGIAFSQQGLSDGVVAII